MLKTLKKIAAELKRANDLKERDIKNKETWGWYIDSSPSKDETTNQVRYGSQSVTTKGRW